MLWFASSVAAALTPGDAQSLVASEPGRYGGVLRASGPAAPGSLWLELGPDASPEPAATTLLVVSDRPCGPAAGPACYAGHAVSTLAGSVHAGAGPDLTTTTTWSGPTPSGWRTFGTTTLSTHADRISDGWLKWLTASPGSAPVFDESGSIDGYGCAALIDLLAGVADACIDDPHYSWFLPTATPPAAAASLVVGDQLADLHLSRAWLACEGG